MVASRPMSAILKKEKLFLILYAEDSFMKKLPSPLPSPEKLARGLTLFILLLLLASMGCLFLHPFFTGDAALQAEIYQNGQLLRTIPLDQVKEPYEFTVTGENGAENTIRVTPGDPTAEGKHHSGGIGIIEANCPDKLCVHQGMTDQTLIPITCLPNHLVIRLVKHPGASEQPESVLDALTY